MTMDEVLGKPWCGGEQGFIKRFQLSYVKITCF